MNNTNMISKKNIHFLIFSLSFLLFSCVDQEKFENIGIHEDTRWEFAPNMYHSEAYEPLSQIIDDSADFNVGNEYNSNPYNPYRMNMRMPPKGTVQRNPQGLLPYKLDSADLALANSLTNPVSLTPEILEEGKGLYVRYCAHCHGESGQGDGPVNSAYKGVANLTAGQVATVSEGHIFHVITYGKGRMWPHRSQVDPQSRWKIAHYVKQKLQKGEQ
jgi:mono/diheme cytochrome c family protein